MYRKIRSSFWTDPKVKSLDPTYKLGFIYLVTNPHTHLSGWYYLPIQTAALESGITVRCWSPIMEALEAEKLVYFDLGHNEVFVVNMLRHQAGESPGNRIVASIANHVQELHSWKLQTVFSTRYDTLSIPYRYPIREMSYQDQEQDQEQELKRASRPAGLPPGFARFWETYPTRNGRKSGKADALKAWKEVRCEPHTDEIVARLQDQIRHKKSCDQNGRFVAEFPDAARWIKKRRFNDEIQEIDA